ncbi:MAG: hypothetical protein AB7Q42_10845 [Acidimicrobiia bacterium]
MRALRRLLLLALVVLGVIVLVRRRAAQQHAEIAEPGGAEWPPFRPTLATPPVGETDVAETDVAETDVAETDVDTLVATPPAAVAVATPDGVNWVAPVDGACPVGFPVKANDNSGIFHVPGGRFYERTVAERCYATPQAAEADGYRQAKA